MGKKPVQQASYWGTHPLWPGSKLCVSATVLSKRGVYCWYRVSLPQTPKPTITKDKTKAFRHHRQDKDKVILMDEGLALIVLDREDYINKAMDLLADRDTYRPLRPDPRNKLKNKLINVLRTIKVERGLGVTTYKDFIQMVQAPKHSLGYPQYMKRTPP